jgi:hypothetical protein
LNHANNQRGLTYITGAGGTAKLKAWQWLYAEHSNAKSLGPVLSPIHKRKKEPLDHISDRGVHL